MGWHCRHERLNFRSYVSWAGDRMTERQIAYCLGCHGVWLRPGSPPWIEGETLMLDLFGAGDFTYERLEEITFPPLVFVETY